MGIEILSLLSPVVYDDLVLYPISPGVWFLALARCIFFCLVLFSLGLFVRETRERCVALGPAETVVEPILEFLQDGGV